MCDLARENKGSCRRRICVLRQERREATQRKQRFAHVQASPRHAHAHTHHPLSPLQASDEQVTAPLASSEVSQGQPLSLDA